jgi:hypothetical protein
MMGAAFADAVALKNGRKGGIPEGLHHNQNASGTVGSIGALKKELMLSSAMLSEVFKRWLIRLTLMQS